MLHIIKKYILPTITILFVVLEILYMLKSPPLPYFPKPEDYIFWRCFYYILHYGTFMSICIIFKTADRCRYYFEVLSLEMLIVYLASKMMLYVFLINKDMPTYINFLNSKENSAMYSLIIIILLLMYNINRYYGKYKMDG